MHIPPSQKGVTLIELSIVLVIIGLIVAGIVGGQSLIHAASLRSIVSDINGFKVAINAYNDYYGYLPGDHPNAQSYWPTDCVDAGFNECNGNGNGWLDYDTAVSSREVQRIWQHLGLAQMISGTYMGNSSPTCNLNASSGIGNIRIHTCDVEDDLMPKSKFGGGYYSAGATVVTRKNGIFLGGRHPISFYHSLGPVMTPADAKVIDDKMDDGAMSTGEVLGTLVNGGTQCIQGVFPTGSYRLSSTETLCSLFFIVD